MNIIKLVLLLLFLFAMNSYTSAQSVNSIGARCPAPNRLSYSKIEAGLNGNITVTPCPNKSTVFLGLVDFANVNFDNAVYNGLSFVWNNQTGTSPFLMKFTPFTTAVNNGLFEVGLNPSHMIQVSGLFGTTTLSAPNGITVTNALKLDNEFSMKLLTECAGTATLAGLGSQTVLSPCPNLSATSKIFLQNTTATGVLRVTSKGVNIFNVTSSAGAGDSGLEFDYFIVNLY